MALARTKTWTSEILSATDLNAEFDNILNYLNNGTVVLAALTVTGNATASAFVPSSAVVPTNGMFLVGANTLGWATGGSTKMSLSPSTLGITAIISITGTYSGSYSGLAAAGIALTDSDSTVGNQYLSCKKADGTTIGSITRAGASSVAFNTTSDYRLKTDIVPMGNASARVLALKPVTFKWADGAEPSEGFIAHEVQAVVPSAVTGEKDAMDGDAPKYQAVDYGKLTPVLAAALKEVIARLNAAGIP